MARELYLHETVDIVGDSAVPYMENSVVGCDREAMADRGLELYGSFGMQDSTGRWPQVVNVWQLKDGWASWQKLCPETHLKRQSNPSLASWRKQAAAWRGGGVDRLLGAMPGCQNLAEIKRRRVRGEVFVHEVSKVRPGAGPEYLAAVAEEWAPVMGEHGHELVGLWGVLLCDTEVCILGATRLDDHIELNQAADAARGFDSPGAAEDDRVLAWRERSREFCTEWREEILIPCPETPMGPTEWR